MKVPHDIELQLDALIDHEVIVHVEIEEEGPVYWDSEGPGHIEYNHEIKGFSLVYLDDCYRPKSKRVGERPEALWYFEWPLERMNTPLTIPLSIVTNIRDEVDKHFQENLTSEDMELIMHGNDD